MPDSPRTRAPMRAIPEEVDRVILRALAKQARDRFASAAVMRLALEEALRLPLRRRARARKLVATVMTGASLLIVAGAGARWNNPVRSAWSHATAQVVTTEEDASAPIPTVPVESLPAAAPVPTAPAEEQPVAASIPAPLPPPTSTPTLAPTSSTTVTWVTPADPEPRRTERSGRDPKSEKQRALAEARIAAKEEAGEPRALKMWALAALRAGELREARRAADAWTLHDDSPEPRLMLATVLDAMGHRSDARAVLEELLQIHPDSAEARHMHARLGAPLPAPDTAVRKGQVARR